MTRRTSSLDRLPSPHPTFREDDSKIHVGCLPRIMAGLRNLATSCSSDTALDGA
ncbi:hypothetical protein ACFY1B_47575 [Streptomyces mirabilis]|uniref:hypothetical protein n=1 Tax=Streptomyces mirabilis TaxID=68239 RepID=UPI0036A81D9E